MLKRFGTLKRLRTYSKDELHPVEDAVKAHFKIAAQMKTVLNHTRVTHGLFVVILILIIDSVFSIATAQADTELAKVNDQLITTESLQNWLRLHQSIDLGWPHSETSEQTNPEQPTLEKAKPEQATPKITEEETLQQQLATYIDHLVLLQHAKQAVDPEVTRTYVDGVFLQYLSAYGSEENLTSYLNELQTTKDDFLKAIEEQFVIQTYLHDLVRSMEPPTEGDYQQLYDIASSKWKKFDSFQDVQHLLLPIDPENSEHSKVNRDAIFELLELAKRSGKNFSNLVQEHSKAKSAEINGSIGSVPEGRLIPDVEEFLRQLPPGDFGVVTTQYGYHLVTMTKIEKGLPLKFDETFKADAIKRILLEHVRKVFKEKLEEFKKSSKIEIYTFGN